MTPAHVVLVPGHWLGGWAWDQVAPGLSAAGHQVTSVTLPGLASISTDRATITLDDHIGALLDVVESAGSDVVLVAHSGAGKIVSGVLDRRPEAVHRTVYVDSGPAADGDGQELSPEVTELPLPSWEQLTANGASLAGLSDAQLAEFRARAVPQPAGPSRQQIRLSHPDRRSAPTTIIACSIPAAMIAELAAAGNPMFAEVAQLTDLTYVELPTGHWPMWSRPDDLAAALIQAIG